MRSCGLARQRRRRRESDVRADGTGACEIARWRGVMAVEFGRAVAFSPKGIGL